MSTERNEQDALEQHTEAVAFDPFADEEDDAEPGTEAVAFDPFADDETDYSAMGEMAGLLKDLDELRRGGNREDTSQRSRRLALDTFRERRGTRRATRVVADGMVELPWVEPTEPKEALIDPEPAVVKRGIAPPTLHPGDVVASQYEIMGVIAHGGMGWIYLAQDHHVAGRVVVLKGLHSTDNPDEAAAAAAEREFLAEMTHPGIVQIFNFIDDPRVPGGFTVMEYVGGPSLRAWRNASTSKVLQPDIAIAYMLEVLPALDYLHSRGVVYNDLKPDNIIVTEDHVKLIDMGAVSGIGAYGFIYGTKGFQAPEVATEGPSVSSDVYTVGRTLASLVVDLPQTDGVYDPGLPSPIDEPLFRQYTSLYRLLAHCCNEDPAQRFTSLTELEAQMLGVLREIVAVRDGRTYPAQHSLFSPQRTTFGTKHLVFRTDQLIDGIARSVDITPQEVVAALPSPLVNRDDVGAAMLQGSSYAEPRETLETLRQAMTTPQYEHSVEIPFGVVRTMLDLGLTTQARTWLRSLSERFGDNWRYFWYAGVVETLLGDFNSAKTSFSEVLNQLPGEAAPKLALAATDELLLQRMGMARTPLLEDQVSRATAILNQQMDAVNLEIMSDTWSHLTIDPAALRFHAMRLYALVWMTNPTTVSSAFGLSRLLVVENQVELAVHVLDRLNASSRHHRMSKLTTIVTLISDDPSESRIRRAARRLEEIPTNEPRLLQVKAAVLSAAFSFLRSHNLDAAASTNPLFEYSFTQTGIREGLSETLRALARTAPFARHRYALVDLANAVRPSTLF